MRNDETGQDRVSRLAGGYNRLARDFDRAIHLARLSSIQLLLIQCAREESWSRPQIEGKREPEPFRLNLSEIAKVARLDRSGVSRQQAGLVARRVFLDLLDGRHLINKDYQTWVDLDGSPLLTRAQIDHCKRIRRKVRPVDSSLQQGCGLQSTGRLSGCVDSSLQAGGLQSTARKVRPVDSSLQFEGGPIEERAGARSPACAELNSESKRESKVSSIPYLSPGSASADERDREDGPGPRSEADEAVAWVVDRVGVAFPGDESIAELMPMWVRSWVAEGVTPIEIQDAVIKALARVRRASGLVAYVKGCLDSRRQAPPAGRPGPGPSAPAPSKTEARRRALLDGFRREAKERQREDQDGR